MPVRARAAAAALLTAAAGVLVAAPVATPATVAAAAPRVAIIVGPVGGLTDYYRDMADDVADAATAVGATVIKAYSPNATWTNVKNAVAGANVIVYFGHGNGYPNPYSSGENIDRVNGWGLNRTETGGDGDDWSTTMAYCGEQALLGDLTSNSDSVRLDYCGGTSNDGINPAPGFTMVYAQAHYAPGFGERYDPSDPLTTLEEAQARVRHYSYPILSLGGTYIATAYGDADQIVERVLTSPATPYGELFAQGEGYSPDTLTTMAHPDVPGAEVWVQRTSLGPNMHFGDPDYWYAFAGDPSRTPGGEAAPFYDIYGSPFYDDIVWLTESEITAGCGGGRFCPRSEVTRGQMASFLVRALDLPPATQDYFDDDGDSVHQADINALAQAGVTAGCSEGMYCPSASVQRYQMASFITRALGLASSPEDFFFDDDGMSAEPDINSFADAGITAGCSTDRFCPYQRVTRDQMAAFLHRALAP